MLTTAQAERRVAAHLNIGIADVQESSHAGELITRELVRSEPGFAALALALVRSMPGLGFASAHSLWRNHHCRMCGSERETMWARGLHEAYCARGFLEKRPESLELLLRDAYSPAELMRIAAMCSAIGGGA